MESQIKALQEENMRLHEENEKMKKIIDGMNGMVNRLITNYISKNDEHGRT